MERRTVAPLPAVRVVRLNGEDIHPLPTTSQLTTTNDVGPVSHGGSAMPASRRAQTALILPAVGGGVVRAHSPGVSVVDVTTGYKDLALNEGAAMTAAGHLHGSFHLPLVGGGHVALHRGLNAITISPSNGKQKAIEDVEAKVCALLDHVAQVNPSVEAGVISKDSERNLQFISHSTQTDITTFEKSTGTVSSYLQKLPTACLAWFLASFWSSPPATYRKPSKTATH